VLLNKVKKLIEPKYVYVKPSEIIEFRKRQYDPGFIERLGNSIKTFGILNDPILRFDIATQKLQVILGHARVEAGILIGLPEIRGLLMDLDDVKAYYLWATENKEDWNLIR
jgi:ParB-like chromosome segregation protein Spo0J